MASSQNANRIVQFAFAQAMVELTSQAARCGRILPAGDAAVIRIGQGAFGGIGQTLSRTATDAALSDYFTYETEFSLVKKVVKHKVPVHTMTSDVAFQDAGKQLSMAALATLDQMFFDGLAGLFTADHPRAGAGAGQVGAGKKYLDTGLKFLAGEGGEGTQDNLLTGALDEANLNNAIKLLLAQRTDRGIPAKIGSMGGLTLIVDPKNAKIAHELVKSQLSGADMASNFVSGVVQNIVATPMSVDDDDWFLTDPLMAPIGLGVGADPTARISVTTDGLFYELVAEVMATFFKAPYEQGLVGSNFA